MFVLVCGMLSEIIMMKIVKESRTVMLSETFSPASGGIQNTSRVSIDNIRQGIRIFKT